MMADPNSTENSGPTPAKEATVLDAEGNVIYQPSPTADAQSGTSGFKVAWGSSAGSRSVGLFPKLALGGVFAVMLVLGLTVAGIALAIVFVGFLAKMLFRPRR